MDDRYLIEQNPWWRDIGSLGSDRHLKRVELSEVKWDPRIRYKFDLSPGEIYTLRGPRQVGKTTLIKIMAQDLIYRGISPYSVFYFSLDLVSDPVELEGLVNRYFDLSGSFGAEGTRYLFLDEISNVDHWGSAIKYLVDSNKLKDTTMIMTGSHSMDIKRSSERLPGRVGEGSAVRDKIMMPMKFSEYVQNVDPELWARISEHVPRSFEPRSEMILSLFEGEDHTVPLTLYQRDLQSHLGSYMLTGGIISAINEFKASGKISPQTYEVYIRSLVGDLTRNNLNERIAKLVARSLLEMMGTSFSYNSIADLLDIGSHNTVAKYISSLEDSYVLDQVYQVDHEKNTPMMRSNRKAYFTDPFILHSVNHWVNGTGDPFGRSVELISDPESSSRLIEAIVCDHIIRLSYNMAPSDHFSHHEKVMFWRKKRNGREIDFVLWDGRRLHPLEVKYRNRLRVSDWRSMHNFPNGLILTKGIRDERNRRLAVPVEQFLILI